MVKRKVMKRLAENLLVARNRADKACDDGRYEAMDHYLTELEGYRELILLTVEFLDEFEMPEVQA